MSAHTSNEPLVIHLRDLRKPLVDAWNREFAGIPSVHVSCGDIFSTKSGQVAVDDPIDVKADAIVSPANSFGFMDGGIDAVYTYQFGDGLQQRLQAVIEQDFDGELPVGTAVVVPTMHKDIPWCISAPTMRVPRNVAETVNAYLAFRATLLAVIAHNASGLPAIKTILCPGPQCRAGKCRLLAAPGRCASPGIAYSAISVGCHDPYVQPPMMRSTYFVETTDAEQEDVVAKHP